VKPPPFEYHDPDELGQALGLLAEHGDEAKVLAGGQSLVPLLNFRLARPEVIVDINRVQALAALEATGPTIRIGAMTRQATLELSAAVASRVPLLVAAVRLVGHSQIRNRGTVGGSVAHADPSAELPLALTVLDARFHIRSAQASRAVPAAELFVTHLTTTLEPEELLVEIEVPVPAAGTGWAFEEFARRHGDFALGGAAVLLALDPTGAVIHAQIGLLAAADTPVLAPAAAELIGRTVDAPTAEEIAALVVSDVEPTGDIHGDTKYRRGLLQGMVRRSLLAAAARAKEAV
jgi:CO/xanthine dehydrogenase FAD-binding subunit